MTNDPKSRTVVVHKEGEEGTIQVRHLDGIIVAPPQDERPDWAEGLAAAMIQERVTFYSKRLGEANSPYATQLQSILDADTIAFEDLGWIGVNAEGQEVELEADSEHRMETIGRILGIDRDEGTMGEGVTAEREVAGMSQTMTKAEHEALLEGQRHGFEEVAQDRKDGTNG